MNNDKTTYDSNISINGRPITSDMAGLSFAEIIRITDKNAVSDFSNPLPDVAATCVSFVSFRKLKRYLRQMKKTYRTRFAVEIRFVEGTWYCHRKSFPL